LISFEAFLDEYVVTDGGKEERFVFIKDLKYT